MSRTLQPRDQKDKYAAITFARVCVNCASAACSWTRSFSKSSHVCANCHKDLLLILCERVLHLTVDLHCHLLACTICVPVRQHSAIRARRATTLERCTCTRACAHKYLACFATSLMSHVPLRYSSRSKPALKRTANVRCNSSMLRSPKRTDSLDTSAAALYRFTDLTLLHRVCTHVEQGAIVYHVSSYSQVYGMQSVDWSLFDFERTQPRYLYPKLVG